MKIASEFKLTPKTIAKDFISGIIVFLVALPLCMGIAIASDADPIAGLISGIVGGIVVGLVSGSHTSVSGPAAGLTAIVAAQIANLHTYETFLLALVLGGAVQVCFGLLRAGALSAFFPSSVIKGLLAAIGVILIFKQLPLLLGYSNDMEKHPTRHADHSYEIGDILFSFIRDMREIVSFEGGLQWGAISIGVFSLALLYAWDHIPTLKKSLIPAPLVIVILGALLCQMLSPLGRGWMITPKQLVDVPSARSIVELSSLIRLPDFTQILNLSVYIGAITIAVVASLETLLNLDAVDKLDRQQRSSVIVDHYLQTNFAKQMNLVLNSAVNCRMPFLATIALGIEHCKSMHSHGLQCFANSLKFVRLYGNQKHFHRWNSMIKTVGLSPKVA